MSDQERKGTSTIIKGFSRRGTKTDLATPEIDEAIVEKESLEQPVEDAPVESVNDIPAAFNSKVTSEVRRTLAAPDDGLVGPDRRLAHAPLATLLPRVGDVRNLEKNSASLLKRHGQLAQARRENSEERAGRLSAEELMLSQIVNWLGEELTSDE